VWSSVQPTRRVEAATVKTPVLAGAYIRHGANVTRPLVNGGLSFGVTETTEVLMRPEGPRMTERVRQSLKVLPGHCLSPCLVPKDDQSIV
jgi:hypothetical protein